MATNLNPHGFNPNIRVTLSAERTGDDEDTFSYTACFSISVPPDTSAGYPPGTYHLHMIADEAYFGHPETIEEYNVSFTTIAAARPYVVWSTGDDPDPFPPSDSLGNPTPEVPATITYTLRPNDTSYAYADITYNDGVQDHVAFGQDAGNQGLAGIWSHTFSVGAGGAGMSCTATGSDGAKITGQCFCALPPNCLTTPTQGAASAQETGAAGSSTAGTNTAGTSTQGSNTVGTNTVGTNTVGSNTVGTNTVGTNTVGTNTVGSNTVGTNTVGTNTVGSNTVGTNTVGTNTVGTNTVGH